MESDQRFPTRTIAHGCGFCLLYVAGAELARFLAHQSIADHVPPIWPPAGLLVAALVSSRVRMWPVFLAASVVAHGISAFLHTEPVLIGASHLLTTIVAACLGAALVRQLVTGPVTMTRILDVIAVVGCAAVLTPMVGAGLGVATLTAVGADTDFGPAWRALWLSHIVGVLVFAPLLLAWTDPQAPPQQAPRWKLTEAVALFAGLILLTLCVYGEVLPRTFRVPVLLLPFLLWASLRFDPRVAASALFVVAMLGIWNVTRGRGPYAAELMPWPEQLLRAQGTLTMICLCVLILAATVAERRQAEAARIALVNDLQTALAEIKTLRGFIPICAWCKKVRADDDFWHSVEDYLTQHTQAKFSHSVCPECMGKEIAQLEER